MNKPLFVSVGYSACHWCHVMAQGTFPDTDTADYMNGNFICIKIDREQRPDIDQYLMAFLTSITGSGEGLITLQSWFCNNSNIIMKGNLIKIIILNQR